MHLTVTRRQGTALSTPGSLDINGVFECYTLEPRRDESQGKPFAIPLGRYQVQLLFSRKFGRVTPHVMNVPGFEAIEIHYGNYPADTEGCLLVGQTRQTDFVGNSREAFGRLMEKLLAASTPIFISYEDAATVMDPELGL